MDAKKSYKADLESRRASGFLLGLVVALSLFLVSLEFTTHGGQHEAGDDFIDDLSQDIEMAPAIHHDDMVAAAAGRKKDVASDKINIVDKAADEAPADNVSDVKAFADALRAAGIGGITDIQASPLPQINVAGQDNPLNFQVVEALPEFPGGMSAFVQWLTKNLKYPVTAQRARKQGTVLVAFIINKDGSTTAHKIVKSAAPELDREALRVVRMMPKWKPGEDRGKPCRTYFCIPIVFKL